MTSLTVFAAAAIRYHLTQVRKHLDFIEQVLDVAAGEVVESAAGREAEEVRASCEHGHERITYSTPWCPICVSKEQLGHSEKWCERCQEVTNHMGSGHIYSTCVRCLHLYEQN